MGSVDPSVIEEQMRAELHWSFTSPGATRVEGRYRVIATAGARPRIDAPRLPPKSYDISAKYGLTVDTRLKKVAACRLDLSLVNISGRSAFVDTR